MLLTKIFLKIDASNKTHFEVFPKEKGGIFIMPCFGHASFIMSYFALVMLCFDLAMLLLTKSAPKTKILALQLIPYVLETKREIHYSPSLFTVTIHPLLFMTLFTPNFCLFKGGCPLCLKQVLVQVFFSRESSF